MRLPEPEKAEILLRVHTNARRKPDRGGRRQWARYALVIDTETTLDTKLSLTFGFYRFCELQANGNYACQEEGIFYPDKCDRKDLDCLRRYTESARAETIEGCPKRLFLHSRSQFAKEALWVAYNAEVVIVGCNLVFDLTRLAVDYRIS